MRAPILVKGQLTFAATTMPGYEDTQAIEHNWEEFKLENSFV